MTELPQIEQQLTEFLQTQCAGAPCAGGADLPSAGLSDEDRRRGLVDFIAQSWGVVVDESELASQHVQSVGCLARLVAAKVLGGGEGRAMHCREIDAFRSALSNSSTGA